jgi:hypothetical protein
LKVQSREGQAESAVHVYNRQKKSAGRPKSFEDQLHDLLAEDWLSTNHDKARQQVIYSCDKKKTRVRKTVWVMKRRKRYVVKVYKGGCVGGPEVELGIW